MAQRITPTVNHTGLLAIRHAAHVSQEELAKAAGVHDSLICRIETGERSIEGCSYATVVRIAKVLCPDLTVEQVFPVMPADAVAALVAAGAVDEDAVRTA